MLLICCGYNITDLCNTDLQLICCPLDTTVMINEYIYVVVESMPTCGVKPSDRSGEVVNGTSLAYACDVRYSFDQNGGDVEMSWVGGQGSAPVRGHHATTLSNPLSVLATPPVMQARLCRTIFGNRSTSVAVNVNCLVPAVNVTCKRA